ncbi:MAG: J domain-containing protein [Tannerellaceae bacterium]
MKNKQQELFGDEIIAQAPPSAYPMIKKGKTTLTKVQAEFNRLNKKIASIKEELSVIPEKKNRIQCFFKENLSPLQNSFAKESCRIGFYLDEQYDKNELSKKDRFALSGYTLEHCSTILDAIAGLEEEDRKAISDIHLKHQMIQTGLSKKQIDKQKVKDALEVFPFLLGIKPTAKMKKAKTEEELLNLVEEYIQEQIKKEAEQSDSENGNPTENEPQPDTQFQEEPPHKKRKMTKAELTRKIQEEQTQKSIRTIYMELAKGLHPDLEQDDEVRQIKEERMKQLNEAYQKKDLSSLLTMQLNWLEESIKSPETQPDEVLKGYNKVLKEELKKLKDEQLIMEHTIDLPTEIAELISVPMKDLDLHLKQLLYRMQLEYKDIMGTLKKISTKSGLKKEIKLYVENFEEEEEDFWDDELDELFDVKDSEMDKFMQMLINESIFGKKR